MTDIEFIEKYKPVFNPKESNYYFETYGEDYAFVASQPMNHVWTVIDTDNGLVVTNGFHHVNRINYMLTEIPYNENDFIEIKW